MNRRFLWTLVALWAGCGVAPRTPDTAPEPPEETPDAAPTRPASLDAAPVTPDAPPAVRDTMVPMIADAAVMTAADGPGAPPGKDWWDDHWRARRPVTITHPGKEELVDFVVPVALPADGAGADLRFVDRTGTVLAHERESATLAWVRVPRIAAGASGVSFWMYARNPAAPAPAPAEVWSATHAAVWHFGGDGKDATTHHADGAKTLVRFAASPLGSAAAFDRSKREHVSLITNTRLVSGAAAVTVSAWVQHTGEVQDGQDIILGIGTADTAGHLSRVSVALSPGFGLIGEANPDEGSWDVIDSPAGGVPNGAWHHLAVVIDVKAKTILLYKDGVALRAPFKGRWTAASYPTTPSNRVTIGCEEDESKSFFNGMLDELRVQVSARSPAWLAAEAAAPKMATVGEEERLP
jgi:hypothetical protein